MLHQNLFYNDDHQATCLLRPPGEGARKGLSPARGECREKARQVLTRISIKWPF